RPYIDMIIPTLVDPDMAPPGQHTMSCFVQYAPYHLADGAEWDDAARDALGETVLDTIEERVPGIRKLIIGKQVLTPLDIERRIGLSEGNIFQGELSLEQLFFNRPVPGFARFRTPVDGLWMCGSAAHPGGGLMGATGGIAELLPTAGRLRRSVIDALKLRSHGLELIRPEIRMLALRDDGDPIAFWADAERTAAALEQVDPLDAGAYVAYDRHVRALSGFLARMNRTTPARLDKATPRDVVEGLKLGKAYRGLGTRTARELTRALPMAAADFVREWFRDDAICGALAARGTLMTELGPWSAGSALVLLNDMAEGDGGAAGETALVGGGPQALGDALATAARAAGAEVRTGAAVERLVVEEGRITGVTLAGGERIDALAVASSLDPKTTLCTLLDPVAAGPRTRWRASNIR